jgi:hypothetical protein
MTFDGPPPVDPYAPAPPVKRGTLVRVSDVVAEPINWLWPGHLARGKLHDISGDPDLGKSTVTVDLAARITTGKPWPDGQPGTDPAGVVLISVEDGLADTIRPRLAAAGADLDRVAVLTEIDTGTHPEPRLPELPTDVDTIRDALLSVDGALLVIDPLMACLADNINAHKDQDVRRALAPLARAAEQTGTAVVIVRHLTKGDSDKALYRGGGSIGIIGAARIGYTVGRHPDDRDNSQRAVLAAVKANICSKPASLAYHLTGDETHGCARVDWEGEVPYTANDLVRTPNADRGAENDPAAQWLLDYLTDHDGEAPVDDIYAAGTTAGISERTLRRARTRAGVIAGRSGFPARAVWRLPSPATTGHDGGRTGRTDAEHDGEHQSGRHPLSPGRTGRTGRTGQSGRTGRTDSTDPTVIGPCARCGRPTRRYGDDADGTLCTACTNGDNQ